MPDRRVQLFPVDGNPITLYSDEGWGGQTTATWINKSKKHWQCNLVKSEFSPVCGLAAELSSNKTPMDFSKYKAMAIKLKYTGEAPKLRIYLRNHNPAYSNLEDPDSFKFNSVNIPSEEFSASETIIHLSEFSVESWWLEERNIPRELAHPELENILNIGIDYPYPQTLGEHSVQMDSIELIGPLFEKEKYYLVLLILWSLVFLFEQILHLRCLGKSKSTELKSNDLNSRNTSDVSNATNTEKPLTALPQKNDLPSKIDSVFNDSRARRNATLILFKVNNFQEFLNSAGEDATTPLLTALNALIVNTLQSNDTFSRWGEEEFLILSTETNKNNALKLCERLHQQITDHTFETDRTIKAEVSIGGTSIHQSDDFGKAFMRAEQALYQASSGRGNDIRWLEIDEEKQQRGN